MDFLINYFFIALAILIGLIAVEWILFERAGEPGWKAIVPFYSSFIMHKITFGEDSKWYWFLILIPGYSFYMQYSFTRAYGYSNGMAILSVFFPTVLSIVMVLQDARYGGPLLYSYNCVLCLFLAHDIIIVLKIFESVLVFIMVEPNSVFISYLLFIGLFGLLVMIIWRIFVFILGLIKKIQSKRQQKQACLEVQSILKESGYLRVIGDCFKNIRTVESGHFCYDFVELATKNNVESFQITNNFYKYLQKHFGVMLSKEQACRLTDVTLTVYDLCDDSTYPEYAFMFVEEVLPSFTLVESKMDTPQSRRDSLHYTIRLTPEYTKLLIKQTK